MVGGGAIGCEIGQAYARFGVAVSIVESADRLLPNEDPEAGQVLGEALAEGGVALRVGAGVDTWQALGLEGRPGKGAFTHVATYHATIVVADLLGRDGPPADHHALPRVAFTDPEVGAVGLTEAEARARRLRVTTGVAQVPSTARGWLHRPAGGEVLGALAVAVQAEVALTTLESMIWAYPTFHRGIEDALRDLRG